MFIILEQLASSIAHAGTSCVKEEERISNSSSIRWTFFQFRSTSSRKEDFTDIDMVKSRETGIFQSLSMSSRKEELMDADMGKSQETKNIIWLTN